MAEIETCLGRLKVSGLREDRLGYHVHTGSDRDGNARTWEVSKEEHDALKAQITLVEKKDAMTHCWYCGKKVTDPTLRVAEGMYDYGTFTGFEVTGVIHKTCAEKGKKEYAGYKWRVVEADQ